ncbi:putative phosphopantetheinyl transferase [Desulforapulum autotrophicum HRM2]|uniref:Phosphopantetheinyl transferase n=1 Tax=Desulforapulum autotrophicum (strain ATCC 43914 / DSM 3382 / VKM B-1955 / HRM2) TaxID=177437 RepID=C0QLH1_DESAH|nr:4'-phosphopantetheinyl transferase superfamily protein [Desulforapulum autotrophicum]ACN16275.1 putative phosphopantetheinyl transferase [Desulforapulum autotrophicum HRM2]
MEIVVEETVMKKTIVKRSVETQQTSAPVITCFEAVPGVKVCCMTITSFLEVCLAGKDFTNFHTQRNLSFKPDWFSRDFLSMGEIDTINRFKSLKKQIEWMAGRFLVKIMVEQTFDTPVALTEITIDHQDQGAPFLRGYPDLRISISHSGDYAGVALTIQTDMDMGVDIEQIGKAPDPGFMRLAFTQREIQAMETTPRKIFTHWTVKEAFLKLIKKGFNQSLHQVEIIGNTILFKGEKTPVTVVSRPLGTNYAISVVIGGSGPQPIPAP